MEEKLSKEEAIMGFGILEINTIQKWAEEVAGEWNGDESGSQEDRAMQAEDIIEKCKELKELLEGMENL
jgi:hypothetical protein